MLLLSLGALLQYHNITLPIISVSHGINIVDRMKINKLLHYSVYLRTIV